MCMCLCLCLLRCICHMHMCDAHVSNFHPAGHACMLCLHAIHVAACCMLFMHPLAAQLLHLLTPSYTLLHPLTPSYSQHKANTTPAWGVRRGRGRRGEGGDRAIKQRCAQHHQRVKPPARLVQPLPNKCKRHSPIRRCTTRYLYRCQGEGM